MQNWKELNVWSSTVYSCDFDEGRQHFMTLFMFVLNFVLFLNPADGSVRSVASHFANVSPLCPANAVPSTPGATPGPSPGSEASNSAKKAASSKDSSRDVSVVSKYLKVPIESTPQRDKRCLPCAKLLTSLESLRYLKTKRKKKQEELEMKAKRKKEREEKKKLRDEEFKKKAEKSAMREQERIKKAELKMEEKKKQEEAKKKQEEAKKKQEEAKRKHDEATGRVIIGCLRYCLLPTCPYRACVLSPMGVLTRRACSHQWVSLPDVRVLTNRVLTWLLKNMKWNMRCEL